MIAALSATWPYWVMVALFLLAAAGVVWFVAAGDTEGDMVDDKPTLDVQNHHGDTRPMR